MTPLDNAGPYLPLFRPSVKHITVRLSQAGLQVSSRTGWRGWCVRLRGGGVQNKQEWKRTPAVEGCDSGSKAAAVPSAKMAAHSHTDTQRSEVGALPLQTVCPHPRVWG